MNQELERWAQTPGISSSASQQRRPRRAMATDVPLPDDEPDLDFLYQLGGSV